MRCLRHPSTTHTQISVKRTIASFLFLPTWRRKGFLGWNTYVVFAHTCEKLELIQIRSKENTALGFFKVLQQFLPPKEKTAVAWA